MIHLQDLNRYYKTKAGRTYVLRNIDLDINPGEFITIMGPSGAGKSTLLNIIGMMDHDWEGEYILDGNKVHPLPHQKRIELNKKYIGYVFQSFNLLDDLTVYENLELPLTYRSVSSSERKTLVCDALDRFQIVGKKDLFPTQLSGGQQQLVAIARAVITNPKIILADEPTGNLHSKQGEEIMDLFTELNKNGTTIIQVTHSEKNASYSNQSIQIVDGWLEQTNTQ